MSNADKMDKSEKFKALKLTIDKRSTDFGKGSVMMMNEKSNLEIRSDFNRFNWAGCGAGYWRFAKRQGDWNLRTESSGKTTLATHVIAEHKEKAVCALL